MTFNPTEFHYWYKEYPQLSLWALKKGILFLPKECSADNELEQYDLTSKVYIFMKRLGQDYNRVMMMDSEERDKLFEIEMKLIKSENEKNNEKS